MCLVSKEGALDKGPQEVSLTAETRRNVLHLLCNKVRRSGGEDVCTCCLNQLEDMKMLRKLDSCLFCNAVIKKMLRRDFLRKVISAEYFFYGFFSINLYDLAH